MTQSVQNQGYALQELEKEALMGAPGKRRLPAKCAVSISQILRRGKVRLPIGYGRRQWRLASFRSVITVFRWRKFAGHSA